MKPLLPDPKKWSRTGMTLPVSLLEDLERIREEANEDRQGPDRLSRDALAVHALEWFVREWDAQRAQRKAR